MLNWHRQGVAQVVSALTPAEITELSLDAEESFCGEAGILYRSFPIQDRSVPDDISSFLTFVQEINAAVTEGLFVAVHCRMGIGRSGIITAALLVLRGSTVTKAFDVISRARGLKVPDTSEQVEWLRQNASRIP
jgi:protein-tyrosine phosphatase